MISNTVSEGYFDTLDVPIVEGRAFQETDRAESRPVAIVNELFARKYYSDQSPIGKRLRLKGGKDEMLEIVGVARQSKYFFLVEPPVEYLYRPLSQNPQQALTILVETAGPSSAAAARCAKWSARWMPASRCTASAPWRKSSTSAPPGPWAS